MHQIMFESLILLNAFKSSSSPDWLDFIKLTHMLSKPYAGYLLGCLWGSNGPNGFLKKKKKVLRLENLCEVRFPKIFH